MSDTDYNQVLDSFAKKSALVASLEACHWLSDTRRRAVVIAELPSSIKSQIVSGNDARQDILTVVSRAWSIWGESSNSWKLSAGRKGTLFPGET